nr:proteasome subunit alpha type-5-like [Lolium perenne]
MFLTKTEYHWLVEHLLPKSMLFQVEYAIEAIKLGSTTVRLKTKDVVVVRAGEERVTTSLLGWTNDTNFIRCKWR